MDQGRQPGTGNKNTLKKKKRKEQWNLNIGVVHYINALISPKQLLGTFTIIK